MKTSDFDFTFPQELIAQHPAKERDHSRLMVLNRETKTIEHKYFFNLIDHLSKGDLLVLNDTKVMKANLVGYKDDGGAKVEVLLVKKQEIRSKKEIWECLVKPGKRLSVGSRVIFGKGKLVAEVVDKNPDGSQLLRFEGNIGKYMLAEGEMPLPPYIKSKLKSQKSKLRNDHYIQLFERYQTVYAKREGAAASPTAGLHFTDQLLKKIKAKGIKIAKVTLHTGLGTFQPIRAEEILDHKIHSEYFEVPEQTIKAIKQAKRVVAVGTTVVRALETIASKVRRLKGETDLFIYPGYKFRIVDAMITNFHWPRTTLILLVSAFAGKDLIMQAYEQAIKEQYRLFSFGDAMFIA